MLNDDLVLMSEEGRESTILDGELTRRILRVEHSLVTIRGFTFYRGASANGGGVCAVDVDLLIEDCTFRENVVGSSFPALPENSPFGCADTLGALPAGCDVSPVLVSGAQLARTDAGVELRWSMSEGVDATGFHLVRHHGDEALQITQSPLDPCATCVFVDREPGNLSGRVSYELVILRGGSEERFFMGTIDLDRIAAVELGSPRPNPMRVDGYVSFSLPRALDVALAVFDVSGRLVRTLHQGPKEAGVHQVPIQVAAEDQSRLGAGVYWIRLQAGKEIRQSRLTVVP